MIIFFIVLLFGAVGFGLFGISDFASNPNGFGYMRALVAFVGVAICVSGAGILWILDSIHESIDRRIHRVEEGEQVQAEKEHQERVLAGKEVPSPGPTANARKEEAITNAMIWGGGIIVVGIIFFALKGCA